MANIIELRRKRADKIAEARKILDTAEQEERGSLSEQEEKGYEKLMGEVNLLKEQIEREERQEALEKELNEGSNNPVGKQNPTNNPQNQNEDEENRKRRADIFRRFLRHGVNSLSHEEVEEMRSLQADSDPSGGYLGAPQEWVKTLIKKLDDDLFIRKLATTFTVTSNEGLGAASLDADPVDAEWTPEISDAPEDTNLSFGKRELKPHQLAKLIKVSRKLVRSSTYPVEQLVLDRMRYKFNVTHEKHFLLGNGARQPLGLFVASSSGISASRDISAGNTQTSPTYDGLKNAKYSLKKQYRGKNTGWLFHRDGIKLLAKLKDNEGRYIWQDSVKVNEPDILLGSPVYESEYVPNTFTTGKYVGMYGDYSYYWIADALSMDIQRLVELYARSNQIGFIGRLETDGMPVLEEAFARVKLA